MRQTIKAGAKRKTPRKPGVWPIPLPARPVKRTAKKKSTHAAAEPQATDSAGETSRRIGAAVPARGMPSRRRIGAGVALAMSLVAAVVVSMTLAA